MPSCQCHPGRSFQVTSMPPSGRSTTPPFSSVGTSAASSGITCIFSSVVTSPSTMQVCDVFEDVRAEAVQRVGFAVVADDQQVGGPRASAGRGRPAHRRAIPPPHGADHDGGTRTATSAPRTPSRAVMHAPSSRRHQPGNQRHRESRRAEHAVVKGAQREGDRPRAPQVNAQPMESARAQPVHDGGAGNMRVLAPPRPGGRGRRHARPGLHRAPPPRRTYAVPVCSDRSTTARASIRTRVCCCGDALERREEAASPPSGRARSRPTPRPGAAREHGDAVGAVHRGHLPDARAALRRRGQFCTWCPSAP